MAAHCGRRQAPGTELDDERVRGREGVLLPARHRAGQRAAAAALDRQPRDARVAPLQRSDAAAGRQHLTPRLVK